MKAAMGKSNLQNSQSHAELQAKDKKNNSNSDDFDWSKDWEAAEPDEFADFDEDSDSNVPIKL